MIYMQCPYQKLKVALKVALNIAYNNNNNNNNNNTFRIFMGLDRCDSISSRMTDQNIDPFKGTARKLIAGFISRLDSYHNVIIHQYIT